jgi:hypothetical protein
MIASLPRNTANQTILFPWCHCLPDPGIFCTEKTVPAPEVSVNR